MATWEYDDNLELPGVASLAVTYLLDIDDIPEEGDGFHDPHIPAWTSIRAIDALRVRWRWHGQCAVEGEIPESHKAAYIESFNNRIDNEEFYRRVLHDLGRTNEHTV